MRHAGRSRMNERRVSGDGRPKNADFAVDDGLDGRLETSRRRAWGLDRDDVRLERGPVEEVVEAGHCQLRIGLGERRRLDVVVRQLPGQPRNLVVEETRMVMVKQIEGPRLASPPGRQKLPRLSRVVFLRRAERQWRQRHDRF